MPTWLGRKPRRHSCGLSGPRFGPPRERLAGYRKGAATCRSCACQMLNEPGSSRSDAVRDCRPRFDRSDRHPAGASSSGRLPGGAGTDAGLLGSNPCRCSGGCGAMSEAPPGSCSSDCVGLRSTKRLPGRLASSDIGFDEATGGLAHLVIAATAAQLGLPLAATNVRHFPMVKGLRPPYRD